MSTVTQSNSHYNSESSLLTEREVDSNQQSHNQSRWGKNQTCVLVSTVALGSIAVIGYLIAVNMYCSNEPEVVYSYVNQYGSNECEMLGGDYCEPVKITNYPKTSCYFIADTIVLGVVAFLGYSVVGIASCSALKFAHVISSSKKKQGEKMGQIIDV